MVSLCMAHGHPNARHYPLPMLWVEALLIRRRVNGLMATEAVLVQMAAASVISKKAGKAFEKRVKAMTKGL